MEICNKVAYINGKGGCGKTTSIFHTIGVLSQRGEPILVIDLDKQRNTTDSLLMNNDEERTFTMYDLLCGDCTPEQAVKKAYFQTRPNAKPEYCGVDIIPSDVRLKDEEDFKGADIEDILNSFIETRGYKWVLVDMPPSNETVNEICFQQIVDFVIVPYSSDGFSVSGYGDLIETVNKARDVNPNLHMLGGFLSRYDNSSFDQFIKAQLQEAFGDLFIDVQIPMTLEIRESVAFGRPISYYKSRYQNKWIAESTLQGIKERCEPYEVLKEKMEQGDKKRYFTKIVNPSIYAFEQLVSVLESKIEETR